MTFATWSLTRKLALVITLVLLVPSTVGATSIGRSGADFLQLPAGARSNALGGAFVAVADDAFAPFWNPAGINQLDRSALSFSHQEGFFKVNNEIGSLVRPIGYRTTYALAGRLLHVSGERRDSSGNLQGTFTNYGLSLAPYYATRLGQWEAGIGLKLIQQKLANRRGSAFAMDAGLLREYAVADVPVRFGLAVQNFGNDITIVENGDPLPRTFRVGLSPVFRFNLFDVARHPRELSKVVLSGEMSYLQPERLTEYSLGMEYDFADFLFLRMGWTDAATVEQDANMSFGFGIDFKNIRVDYTWTQAELLNDKNLLNLTFSFGGTREELWDPPAPPERSRWEKQDEPGSPDWEEGQWEETEEFEWDDRDQRGMDWDNEWSGTESDWREDWNSTFPNWNEEWVDDFMGQQLRWQDDFEGWGSKWPTSTYDWRSEW